MRKILCWPQMRFSGASMIVCAAAASACVQRASFLLPPSENATTTIVVFVPIAEHPPDPPEPPERPIVIALNDAMPEELAYTFPNVDFDVYALLYHCDESVLGVVPGIQHPEGGNTQPIPASAFKALASRFRDREQSPWAGAEVSDTLFALREISVEGIDQRCRLKVETFALAGTATNARGPFTMPLDDDRVLVGVEAGPFEVISTQDHHPFPLSSTMPALAGTRVGEEYFLIGSEGRVVRGTFEHGFTPMPNYAGTASAAAIIARTGAGGKIDLVAASDEPMIAHFNGESSTWTQEQVPAFHPIFGVELIDFDGVNVLAMIQQEQWLYVATSTPATRIPLPNSEGCMGDPCDRVFSMAPDAMNQVIVGTKFGRIYRFANGMFEPVNSVPGFTITALAARSDGVVVGDIQGVVELRRYDGTYCEISGLSEELHGVVRAIVPFAGDDLVIVTKDIFDRDDTGKGFVSTTAAQIAVATEYECMSQK